MKKDSDDAAPEIVIDRVTRELRRAFGILNKKADLEALKAEKSAAKAAKEAGRTQRRLERLANRPSAAIRKQMREDREKAIQQLLKPVTLKALCSECGSELPEPLVAELVLLCDPCSERLRQLVPGLRDNQPTQFSVSHLVSGGSPGGGKRR